MTTQCRCTEPSDAAVRVEYIKIHPNAKEPSRKRSTDCGFDLCSIKHVVVEGKAIAMVPTGLRVAVPTGWYYTIEGRSGDLMKGIIVLRTLIDAGYNGELFVVIFNASDNGAIVESGQRIAQMILHRQIDPFFEPVEKFSPDYDTRGILGWGSSGR